MAPQEIKSFAEFWPYYISEHSRPATRTLHALGTVASTACFAALLTRRKWRLLPLAFIPGYAAAWAGHFLVEHNKPATFEHPLWSFIADYKMVGLMLTNKMEDEIKRLRLNKGTEPEV